MGTGSALPRCESAVLHACIGAGVLFPVWRAAVWRALPFIWQARRNVNRPSMRQFSKPGLVGFLWLLGSPGPEPPCWLGQGHIHLHHVLAFLQIDGASPARRSRVMARRRRLPLQPRRRHRRKRAALAPVTPVRKGGTVRLLGERVARRGRWLSSGARARMPRQTSALSFAFSMLGFGLESSMFSLRVSFGPDRSQGIRGGTALQLVVVVVVAWIVVVSAEPAVREHPRHGLC